MCRDFVLLLQAEPNLSPFDACEFNASIPNAESTAQLRRKSNAWNVFQPRQQAKYFCWKFRL